MSYLEKQLFAIKELENSINKIKRDVTSLYVGRVYELKISLFKLHYTVWDIDFINNKVKMYRSNDYIEMTFDEFKVIEDSYKDLDEFIGTLTFLDDVEYKETRKDFKR